MRLLPWALICRNSKKPRTVANAICNRTDVIHEHTIEVQSFRAATKAAEVVRGTRSCTVLAAVNPERKILHDPYIGYDGSFLPGRNSLSSHSLM